MPSYAKRELPPCPGNPDDFKLVNFREKYYWRLKRGKRKPAVLNRALQARADAMKALKVTIRELRQILADFIQPLPSAYLHQRLFGMLQGSWVANATIDYRRMEGMEIQADRGLDNLLTTDYHVKRNGPILQLIVSASKHALRPYNQFVTEFVLQALLVAGTDEQMRSTAETSVIYDVQQGIEADCIFQFEPPSHEPWLLLLKVACFEGECCAMNRKHYAVRVVGVGKPAD